MTGPVEHVPTTTELAIERTRLAHERTLMAWVRTSASLISFGFTIYKFFQFLDKEAPVERHGVLGPRRFALIMIGLGVTALAVATIEHHRQMRPLRPAAGGVPYSLAAVVAALIACLGALGFISVSLRL
jgi:putative membrane protein